MSSSSFSRVRISVCSVIFSEFLIIASAALKRVCGFTPASEHICPIVSIAPARWPCKAAVLRSRSSRRASSYRLLKSGLRRRAYICVSDTPQAPEADRMVGLAISAAIIFSSFVFFMGVPPFSLRISAVFCHNICRRAFDLDGCRRVRRAASWALRPASSRGRFNQYRR